MLARHDPKINSLVCPLGCAEAIGRCARSAGAAHWAKAMADAVSAAGGIIRG